MVVTYSGVPNKRGTTAIFLRILGHDPRPYKGDPRLLIFQNLSIWPKIDSFKNDFKRNFMQIQLNLSSFYKSFDMTHVN